MPFAKVAAAFVKLKLAGDAAPGAVAVTVYAPAVEFAVNAADVAFPFASVVAVFTPPAKVPLAPDVGAAKVTVTSGVGVPPVVTVATRGAANAVLAVAVCPDPLVAEIWTAEAAVFVREKLAGVEAPETEAVTAYAPAVEFAVNTAEVAFPVESVVAVFFPPAKVPLAPEDGAVKVTVTPLVADPPVVTVATKGAANAVLTVAVCGDPLVAAIDTVGGGGVDLLELPHPARFAIMPRPTNSPAIVRLFRVKRLSFIIVALLLTM